MPQIKWLPSALNDIAIDLKNPLCFFVSVTGCEDITWNPLNETKEWHCAATREGCLNLEARFQQEGLKIHLVDMVKTNDAILKVACIFDGPDADPHAERFKSYQELD